VEEQEDIFELEGMSELDINGQPQPHALAHGQGEQGAGARGGWEGAAAAPRSDAAGAYAHELMHARVRVCFLSSTSVRLVCACLSVGI